MLSKAHVRFGIALFALGERWTYSEIFECSCSRAKRGDFSPEDPADVCFFFASARFLVQSTNTTRHTPVLSPTKNFLLTGRGSH